MGNQKGLPRIERLLEDSVGDAFARFGGAIAGRSRVLLRSEASDGVRTLAGDRFWRPTTTSLPSNASDFEKVSADQDLTADTFAQHLAAYIHEQGWQTYGEAVVRFEPAESLHTGQYRARAVVNPDADPRPPAPAPVPAESIHAYTAEPGVPAMTGQPELPRTGLPGRRVLRRSVRPSPEDPRAAPPMPPASIRPRAGLHPRLRAGGYPPRQGVSRAGRLSRSGLRIRRP